MTAAARAEAVFPFCVGYTTRILPLRNAGSKPVMTSSLTALLGLSAPTGVRSSEHRRKWLKPLLP